MSLNKSATRRVSLLAGSSLAAASLAAIAFTGVVGAPTSALAANECAPIGVAPSANGAAADTYTCTGATTYETSGITYTSQGNLTVNSTGAMNVGTVGVNLAGATTAGVGDNVTFSASNNATITGTSGPVIDITTTSGNITATVGGLNGTAAGVTYGVRMQSTGSGNITFTKNTANPILGGAAVNATGPDADAAVAAITNGGNITLNINTANPNSSGVAIGVIGRLRGAVAETSGAGRVVVNVAGLSGVTASQTDGEVALDVVAGTGGADINLTGTVGGRPNRGTNMLNPFVDALAIRVVTPGTLTVDNTTGMVVGAVDFSGVTGGVRFENLGNGAAGTSQNTFPSGGTWHIGGASVFSAQSDVLIMGGIRESNSQANSSIDFGGGLDTFTMTGAWYVNDGMTITNLEQFNNSGAIRFGVEPDGVGDDVLSMPGATFTGSGTSHLYLDVVLGSQSQVGCETPTGAADCLDLRDGTTSGSTIITLRDVSPNSMRSAYIPDGITLVDVSGAGSTAAEHFTLDPAINDGYVHPLYGPAIDQAGPFVYLYRYDAENQRHLLISQPRSRDIFDYAILAGAAHSIWHMTAATVTDRQTDLRDGTDVGALWARAAGEVTRRDVTTAFEGWDATYTFDNSYNLYAGTAMIGVDLIRGGGGEFDYVLGGQIGYVSSSFDLDESESSGRLTGATGGAYGGLWSDWFFLDGTVNLNGLTLDYQHPALSSKTTTFVNSVGASAEVGTHTQITENSFAEPIASVSWVRTSFEEISLPDGEVQPEDSESLRTGLGMRLGATLPGETVSATYFATGRGWYEFEGESDSVFHNAGADLPFTDEFTGAFGEAELGVHVFNTANTLSGFATTGVKWKSGYSAVNLSLGVRMAW